MPRHVRAAAALGFAALIGLSPGASAAERTLALRAPNLKPEPSSAEAGLWGGADRAEAYVKTSAELNRDPALTAYVKSLACRLAETYCPELRVYVLDRPPLNASAAPNGYLEVNSGLMLRARSEDELAYVLGHEVTHFARNHSLSRWNQLKTTANVVLALQVGVTLGAAAAMYSTAQSGAPNAGQTIDSISYTAQSLNNLIYLQGLASVFAYNREQEVEADELGFEHATKAGYSRAAGASIWKAVIAETESSDFPKVRKSEARASIFATHPVTRERVAALEALAGPAAQDADLEAQRRYRSVIRPHLRAWLRDDLRRRDYGQSLFVIRRLEALGEDRGLLAYFRGEAHRQRRGDGDGEAALAAYREAVAHADAPVEAWREYGDALRRAGATREAADALRSYLAKAPAAEDRWLVEDTLESLGG